MFLLVKLNRGADQILHAVHRLFDDQKEPMLQESTSFTTAVSCNLDVLTLSCNHNVLSTLVFGGGGATDGRSLQAKTFGTSPGTRASFRIPAAYAGMTSWNQVS